MGTRYDRTVERGYYACEAIVHVLPQRLVHRELGYLGSLGTPIRVPLRGRRSILEDATPGRSVAA
jgi:hypothetical protein